MSFRMVFFNARNAGFICALFVFDGILGRKGRVQGLNCHSFCEMMLERVTADRRISLYSGLKPPVSGIPLRTPLETHNMAV